MCLDGLDEAFKCKDTRALSIWFKIYPTLFNMVLPFFDDGSLKDAMAKGVADAKKLQEQAAKGNLDLKLTNNFFKKLSTEMDDSLNNYRPPKPCPPPRKPLINLKLL